MSISPGASGTAARDAFAERLDDLEAELLRMGQIVQFQLDAAVRALSALDGTTYDDIAARDLTLNRAHDEVEQGILRALALQPPGAGDLRVIAAILHINAHLERMGDLCANIARCVRMAQGYIPVPEIQTILVEMAGHAQQLVAAAMTCFGRRDVGLASRLWALDEPLDRLNDEVFRAIDRPARDDRALEWTSRMVLVARYLERIGDHSVEIGEQVNFAVTGASNSPPSVGSGTGFADA